MAGTSQHSFKVLSDVARPLLQPKRSICKCLHSRSIPRPQPSPRRHVSSASTQLSEMEVEPDPAPRWSRTPAAMQGTVKPRFWRERPVKLPEINKDARVLDDFYVQFLGPGGDKLLSDETKWLAVTHKSFDHGRRGFNDRLAFLGRRIYELQTSLTILSTLDASHYLRHDTDPFGRKPFTHPATEPIETLSGRARLLFTHHKEIAKVAEQYGVPKVVRWVPRNPESLGASGAEMVHAQVLYAILGGLALEQGSAVANRIAVERILAPMGLRSSSQKAPNRAAV